MTFHRPINVGSQPAEAPETVWEVLIEVEFQPHLTAEEIGVIQDLLWYRLNEVIAEEVGPHGSGEAELRDVNGRGSESPLFPLVAGEARFTCALDIVQFVETQCHSTALAEIAFDARGRAYELAAQVQFLRKPEHDGVRFAELPDASAVVESQRNRTQPH